MGLGTKLFRKHAINFPSEKIALALGLAPPIFDRRPCPLGLRDDFLNSFVPPIHWTGYFYLPLMVAHEFGLYHTASSAVSAYSLYGFSDVNRSLPSGLSRFRESFPDIAKFFIRRQSDGTILPPTQVGIIFAHASRFLRGSYRRRKKLGVAIGDFLRRDAAANFRWRNSTAVPHKNLLAYQSKNNHIILFAPHAFASQSQEGPSALPSPLVFRTISTDFTPTPCVPGTSNLL